MQNFRPNGLHKHWNLGAIEAGKQVLPEDPLLSNVTEAQLVHDAGRWTGCPGLVPGSLSKNRLQGLIQRFSGSPTSHWFETGSGRCWSTAVSSS